MARKPRKDIPSEEINIEEFFTEPILVEVDAPKLAVVVPVKDFTCNIAHQWYTFHKDVSQKVPENVKKVLLRGKKIRE